MTENPPNTAIPASTPPKPARQKQPTGVIGPPPQPVLIVGLGNPGTQYAGNRHNIGAMVTDVLADRIGARFTHKSACDVADGRLAGVRVILAKPRSYMNVSGPPVAALARFFKIPAAAVLVIHDELDIPFAAIRVKQGGGEGGHNGLRSISASLGTRDYPRVRVGIGRPPGRMDAADYVLRDFSSIERPEVPLLRELAADAVETVAAMGITEAQNQIH